MYTFTPPTTGYRVGTHPLFGRVTHQRGLAIVVYGTGAVASEEAAPSIDGTTVTAVYGNGAAHTITDAEAAVLSAAGYGAYLEEVS